MVLFNHATREMTAKIVYYGPGLCGKTTNLMVIFDKLDPKSKGKMLSLATKTDRTLFFDLLPVDIGKVGNFNLKIQLYTVPGQVFYNETRRLVLKGADSVVFVADSQPSMVDSTRESFANLLENLEQNQLDPNDVPIVIQYNKRDIPGVLPIEELQEKLGFEGYPYTEASALKGTGVMETFKLVSKITAKHLITRLKGGKPETKMPKRAEAKAAAPAPVESLIENLAPEPVADPAPAAEIPMNPFADSMPFAEAGAPDQGYEKMEEVSLEQLLQEGRERPSTFGGDIAVPVIEEEPEDVEEIEEETLVSVDDSPETIEETPVAFEEPPVAVEEEPEPAVMAGPDPRIAELEDEVAQLMTQVESLQAQVASLQSQQQQASGEILRALEDLGELVKRQLGE
jgi:signal recognition particle receptor subunit beta